MGFFSSFRQRRLGLTSRESLATLSHMEDFFSGGENWTQHAYNRPNGTKCLVGAANHVRVTSIDDAKHWLRKAIAAREPTIAGLMAIERFNDSRTSFEDVAGVIAEAKQLAAAEILPPAHPALPSPNDAGIPLTIDVTPAAKPERVRRRSLADWLD